MENCGVIVAPCEESVIENRSLEILGSVLK